MRNFVILSICALLLAGARGATLPEATFDATVGVSAEEASQQQDMEAVLKRMVRQVLLEELNFDEADDVVEEIVVDSPTTVTRTRRAVCQGVLFSIVCQATCSAQHKGKGFCDNGKCGCRR